MLEPGQRKLRWIALCAVLAAMIAGVPGAGGAAEVNVQSDTLFRFMQRDTVSTRDARVLPLYEYLQVDLHNLKAQSLSFHAYGWGRHDLADKDYFADNPTGELLYAYLEYRQPHSNFKLRAGRQAIVGAMANDTVDGVSAWFDLEKDFNLMAYAGLPVAYDTTAGRSGDSLLGGRIGWQPNNRYDFGVSYKRLVNDSETYDQLLGVDLLLLLPGEVNISGRTSYNVESSDLGETFVETRFGIAEIDFRVFLEHYAYADAFAAGSRVPNPFYTLNRGGEEQTDFGADASWQLDASWELGARTKAYMYDVKNDNAYYFSGLLNWRGDDLTQVGGEFGAMQGDAAGNKYLLGRLFFYWDTPGDLPLAFVSGDMLYARYDQPVFGEDGSFFASLGCGQRFFADRLELKISGDYSSDPYFDSDWRGMLVATYRIDR